MIEETLAALTAAITENTAVLREVLAAGGAPTNVVAITEAPKPAKKKAEKVAVVEPESEPPVPENPVTEETPETEQPAAAPENGLNAEALIAKITDAWKAQLTAADPARKAMLKEKFPELRAKWGLAADAKLITLAPTPEKLAGLLADIKDL